MKMAWTQETLRYKSDVLDYEVPSPFDGIEGWPAAGVDPDVRRARRDLGRRGKVQAVSVCPKPYQNPHPELWQPFTISDRSVIRAAQEDILPWMFTPNPDDHAAKAKLYQEESAKQGRDYKLGEHTGILKIVGMADTTRGGHRHLRHGACTRTSPPSSARSATWRCCARRRTTGTSRSARRRATPSG